MKAFPFSGVTFRLTISFLVVCVLFCGCTSSGKENSLAGAGKLRTFSAEELEAGRLIHSQLTNSFYVYTEPRTAKYVQDVGLSLTGPGSQSSDPWLFTVLYNEKIYATSAPGGYVYVTTGVLNFLDNEAELAGILAHEIGRLQFRSASLPEGMNILEETTRTVAMIAPAFGQIGLLAALGMVALVAVADSRESDRPGPEEQLWLSDDLAMRYMIEAGYDPQGWIDVQYKFLHAKQQAPLFYEYYESHPITEERFLRLNQSFQELPLANKTLLMKRKHFVEMTRGVRQIYKG